MSKYRVALFDVDGVLLLPPPKWFSHHYAETRGLDKKLFDEFFGRHRDDVVRGRSNYKNLIAANQELWQWDKDPQELLEMWFKFENHPNVPLMSVIRKLRNRGIFVYLATNQEKYRGAYITERIFPKDFDGAFISSTLGYGKEDPEFFKLVLKELHTRMPELKPQEVIFFDDVQEYVDSAKSEGIDARLYKSVKQIQEILD